MGAAFIFLTVVGAFFWKVQHDTPVAGGNFTLTSNGQPWNFSDSPKKLNLLYFGYVKCPDVCPMTLSFAGGAFRDLTPEQLENVRFIFVSVDAAHDKPKDVADYATNFYPSFIGLSGSKEQIDAAIGLFPASYTVELNPKSYLGYSIIHTDRIFILNQKGFVIDSIPNLRASKTISEKIKENL